MLTDIVLLSAYMRNPEITRTVLSGGAARYVPKPRIRRAR